MKMNKKTLLVTSLTVVAIAMSLKVGSVAFATTTTTTTTTSTPVTQSSLTTEGKITMQQVSDIVKNANAGCTIGEIELKTKNGVVVYEIDITNSDSTKSEVVINAENGTIIQTKAKADKQTKNAEKVAVESQQQALDKNWASMTAAQKEQVYALKDAEFDAQIAKVKSHVAAGYKTQAEVDTIISQIQTQKSAMRTSGNAPEFKSIVSFSTVSSN